MDESPRRRVLRTGGTLLAGGLAVGLGGCLQNDGTGTPTDDGDDGGDGGDDLPAYTDWLPAPAAFGRDHYQFRAATVATLRDHRSAVEGTRFESLLSAAGQYLSIDASDVTSMIDAQLAWVVLGDFGEYASALESEGAAVTETYHGYDIYDGAVAVGDGAIAFPRNREAGDLSGLKAAIDAKRGTADRYVEVDDDCRRLVAALGDAALLFGRPHPGTSGIDGVVAYGGAWTVEGKRTTLAAPLVFENRDVVAVDAVESAVADADFFDPASSTSVTRRGRSVVVTATFPTDTVEYLSPPYLYGGRQQQQVPKAAFSWDYERRGDDAGVLTIQHDGGDSIKATELFLRGSGIVAADEIPDTEPADLDVSEPGARWPNDAASGQVGDAPGVVGGDEVRIGVASDYKISVVWEPVDGATSATLGDGAGPDA
ncbi:hypothetical protein SAMN05216388_1003194 [Halorientalis persicus]|uniref:Uncharacterized protein n=1 Tax=Halorientalis persicus TaxID=1367881 RepID=A0A1H8GV22_9EURY|nr:hypothetical protein [Halorientalis persicus]SEN47118.1 hypothetical protein SAMN05216388_1003194 [Halorientalis persicus]